VAHGAAHDAPQHVAATLVRWKHAVGDEKRGGPQVVGDHPMAREARALGRHADRLRGSADQGLEQVDVVVVVLVLEDCGDTLEPHARIDRRAGKIEANAIRGLLILHEDEIPDLDEAVTVGVRRARRAARDPLPVVVEDLRAGAAGSGVPHAPEIVGGRNAHDTLVRQAGDLLPKSVRLLVLGKDGDEKPFRRQPELTSDQRPGVVDRALLEVVSEREVAEHLEKGVVPRRVADIVEVVVLAPRADGLLRRGSPRIGPLLDAREDVLELHHARIGEHQRGVVARHQRG
jgi:hypothetical protein